jgi:hypothetical protein
MRSQDVHPSPTPERPSEETRGWLVGRIGRALSRLQVAVASVLFRLAGVIVELLPTEPSQSDRRDGRRGEPADGPDPEALRRVDMARKNGKGGYR